MSSDYVAQVEYHYETLLHLETQRQNGEFCDIVLKVDDKAFSAHKSVLAASSDYFKAMFTIEMEEKSKDTISIQSVTPTAMEQVLNCIYTGKAVITEANLGEILHASSMFQLTNFVQACETFMLDVLNNSNCCSFWELSNLYSFKKAMENINEVFLNNFEEIKIHPSFLKLDMDTVSQILSSDELQVDTEFSVFEFVVSWVKKDVENRKECFPTLFKHVRLQYIPIKKVIGEIRTSSFVKDFPVCRDLVEEAFSYYITPNIFAAQKFRKCFVSEPNAMLLLKNGSVNQQIFNHTNNRLFTPATPPLYGLNNTTILQGCAAAFQHPVTVLCGGIQNFEASSQVVRFDGIRWMKMPSLNESRCGAAAVFFKDKLFVFGGELSPVAQNPTFSDCSIKMASSYERFSKEWDIFSLGVQPRSYWTAQTYDDRIYLIGGFAKNQRPNSSNNCKVACRNTFIFYPEKNVWKNGPDLNYSRASFSSATVNTKIFVFDGMDRSYDCTCEVLNLSTEAQNVWTSFNYGNYSVGVNIRPNSAGLVNDRLYVVGEDGRTYNFNQQNHNLDRVSNNQANDCHLCIPINKNLLTRSILQFDN